MTVQVERALSRRERTHAATVEEIKQVARRHMAEAGTGALNLRAVARDMGMTPSALYRYFANREAILTALIIDSYDALGGEVEAAAAAVDPAADAVASIMSVVHVFRDWAVAHPPEWALLYGSPVPGYEPPEDTIDHMLRPTNSLLDLLRQAIDAGAVVMPPDELLSPPLRAAMDAVCGEGEEKFDGLSALASAAALSCWCSLLGVVGAEVFGQLPPGLAAAPGHFFDFTMAAALGAVGFDVRPWLASRA